MPQMSPLMWTVLMIFFTFFYLSLSVMIYYEHCLSRFDVNFLRLGSLGGFMIFF